MEKLNRRTFLKLAATTGLGIVTGIGLVPTSVEVNNVTSDLTKHPTGNSGMAEQERKTCATEDCTQGIPFTPTEKFQSIIISPVEEEVSFRTFPSFVVSDVGKNPHLIKDIFTGTGGYALTRREILGGLISSILFGLSHNLTETGFDTQTIPASQTFDGFVLWYLQRKKGFLGNVSAHIALNARIISLTEK